MTTMLLAPYPPITGGEPCREPGTDPEDWFASAGDVLARKRAVQACLRCPVRTACLAYALDHPTDTAVGIWAATTPGRRQRLRSTYLTDQTEQDTE